MILDAPPTPPRFLFPGQRPLQSKAKHKAFEYDAVERLMLHNTLNKIKNIVINIFPSI